MKEPTPREGGIVTAIRSGDVRRAFELLLATCHDGVYFYCDRLTRDGDALAVYDQVLQVATNELQRIDVLPRAWLYRIARQVIAHYHVREGIGEALGDQYGPTTAPGAKAPADDVLSTLVPLQQEILQLALWHGLRLREIAYVLQRPLVEVRQIAAQGLMITAAERRQGLELLS